MKVTIPLSDDDFVPMDEFPLAWRWADAGSRLFAEGALARVRALRVEKAASALDAIKPLEDPRGWLGEGEFGTIRSIETGGGTQHVVDWLLELVPRWDAQVLVSWDASKALVMDAEVFCRYWDEFCYPSSDDVLIWSMDDEWVALYCHDERMFFARRAKQNGDRCVE